MKLFSKIIDFDDSFSKTLDWFFNDKLRHWKDMA